MAEEFVELERTVRALHDAIGKLHDAKHAERLLQMMHRPGWTTKREEEFVHAQVEGMHSHVANLHKAFDALIAIADKIGR
jgi:CHAD domain-containing protein